MPEQYHIKNINANGNPNHLWHLYMNEKTFFIGKISDKIM